MLEISCGVFLISSGACHHVVDECDLELAILCEFNPTVSSRRPKLNQIGSQLPFMFNCKLFIAWNVENFQASTP